MKKMLLLLGLTACLCACHQQGKHWEYKVYRDYGMKFTDHERKLFEAPDSMLNAMGKEGWELVEVYTELGTPYYNFGNPEYVNGLRGTTRTEIINFVFKREAGNGK